jgi:hypothetical protein
MTKYAQILLKNRRRSFWLRLEAETAEMLIGIEVRQDGDEVIPRGRNENGERFTERRRFIDKAAIADRTPGEMSYRYGELVTS